MCFDIEEMKVILKMMDDIIAAFPDEATPRELELRERVRQFLERKEDLG